MRSCREQFMARMPDHLDLKAGRLGPPLPVDDEQLRIWIEEAVGAAFQIQPQKLRGPTRGRARIALARQVSMYIAHVACTMTLTDVGEMFDRDRTTVAHACAVIENRRDEPDFDRAIELLEEVSGGLIRRQMRRGIFGARQAADRLDT